MNVLVTGALSIEQSTLDAICAMGHTVYLMQDERSELPCEASCIDGVICNGLFLHHSLECFTSLKYIQLTSAGFDRVPLDQILVRGIQIHNARGVYSIPMAEFAICGVLQLYKQCRFFLSNCAENRWRKHRGLLELTGKTVCIIGCGSVGVECAKRFSAFECRVIGVDVRPVQCSHFEQIIPLDCLLDILPEADIVVLSVPLLPETRHLLDAKRLEKMKNGAILVNIARGAVVDTSDLIAALKTKLGGAVLDVFEEEPLNPDSPLWKMENVVLTPHNSFVGEGNQMRLHRVIMDNLEQFK